jgi:hypothetical protein
MAAERFWAGDSYCGAVFQAYGGVHEIEGV